MHGRTQLILRALVKILPGLAFAFVFIGGGYTLLALAEHSWWKPLTVLVGAPLVAQLATRTYRRWRPRSANTQPAGDAMAHRRSRDH